MDISVKVIAPPREAASGCERYEVYKVTDPCIMFLVMAQIHE